MHFKTKTARSILEEKERKNVQKEGLVLYVGVIMSKKEEQYFRHKE